MTRRRRRKAIKPSVTREEFTAMSDTLINGIAPERRGGEHGWACIFANTTGRTAIDAVFPGSGIHWWFNNGGSYFGEDWATVLLNVPRVMAMFPNHRLPLEITNGANLNEATPDALAVLLAAGVRRQGARAAVLDEMKRITFLKPIDEH
jgi:hypothetical protein